MTAVTLGKRSWRGRGGSGRRPAAVHAEIGRLRAAAGGADSIFNARLSGIRERERDACAGAGSIWIHEAAISSLSLDTSSKSRYRIRKSHAPNPGPSSCPDTLSQLPPPPPPIGLVADPTSRHVVPVKVTTFPGLPHLRVSLPDAPFVLFRAHFRPQLRYRSFL